MKLYLSDERFEVGGQPYEGIPILVDNTGHVVDVALHFCVDRLLRRSPALDEKTWLAYGQHLYDYFGYLEAKGMTWDEVPSVNSGNIPPISHYVQWCRKTVGNCGSYTNDKVGTVLRLYRWARNVGLIDELPVGHIEVPSGFADEGHLAHTSGRGGRRTVSELFARESEEPIEVLSRRQIDDLIRKVSNPTHRAVLHLGLNAGLRAEELASFPLGYVVDCGKVSSKVRTVAVRLNPAEMRTKNNKSRVVRVSVPCMNLLWQYRESVRETLLKKGQGTASELFLTRFGKPFVDDGFVAPLARLGVQLGFHIHPHMLRHTFATHTLASLEDLKRAGRLRGSPLVVLQRMLGHASITTTSRYLHFLDSIDDAYATQYQAEIDGLALAYVSDHPDVGS